MTMRKTFTIKEKKEILQFLRSLGKDPDEIALVLHTANIKGSIMGFYGNCPVEEALAQIGYKVRAGGSILPKDYLGMDSNTKSRISTPRAVHQFIICFDSGEYPELELKHRKDIQ